MHPTVRALLDATDEPGDSSLRQALTEFLFRRAAQFTLDVRDLDVVEDLQVKHRGADRLALFGWVSRNRGDPMHFWLDVTRDPAPGITATWVLSCQLDTRTRAGKEAARNPWGIERPEHHEWRVVLSNAETAEDERSR
jgi:hypothetical protein